MKSAASPVSSDATRNMLALETFAWENGLHRSTKITFSLPA
jgi:hypothetical protein